MTVKEAAELLLSRINRVRNVNNAFFGATDGTIGNINLLQKGMNQALGDWREHKDTSGLQQITAQLHMYGNLTDQEYEQIMETLDGEK